MTHHTTLVQRCRATNSLLADELEREFRRLENDRADAATEIEHLVSALEGLVEHGTDSPQHLAAEAAIAKYKATP